MLRLLLAFAMGGASSACALAAVGWVLYAQSPAVAWVVQVFAACGFVAGLACGALHLHFQRQPAPAPAALPSEALASLVRATLASAATERQARPGSAADRRPAALVTTTAPPLPPSAPTAPQAPTAPPAPPAPGTPRPAPAPANVAAQAEVTTP